MPKVATKYLETDPWAIVEKGFHKEHARVSESIFSLGNEYMGVRGYFEEGCSGDTLLGSYLNGVYAKYDYPPHEFKSMARYDCFMVNAVDWLYTRITLDGETLDPAKSKISGFVRTLDMKTGTLTRELTWKTPKGKQLKITFVRFLSMISASLGCQRIIFEGLNFSGTVKVVSGLDFAIIHENKNRNFWSCPKKGKTGELFSILGEVEGSGQRVFSCFRLTHEKPLKLRMIKEDKFIGAAFSIKVKKGSAAAVDKLVVNHVERRAGVKSAKVWTAGIKSARKLFAKSFDDHLVKHAAYWADVWDTLDITIEGDPGNQQGVRFCIYQLHQTYHGVNAKLNVGAKGLTGESYNGQTFWDTETYCLPFYIFNNPKAARNLLGYRHETLPGAVERAKELDCEGARYPMCTIDGAEHCRTWQHGDLEIHVPAAISYGVWNYAHLTGDTDFLYSRGVEMLMQISRYYASRGAWSPLTGEFGFWGVMGADEFCMMVNNNTYTNFMAKKTFEWTLDIIAQMRKKAPKLLAKALKKVKLLPEEIRNWRKMIRLMRINYDKKTALFEQHDGYFDLPHVDVKNIPVTEIPIYHNWAYVRIFRNNMIKQPDVLLLPFFFSQEFDEKTKRVNYEYYEPRCVHESSLSPGIHSILAAELGLHGDAHKYSQYACRLDLDDYNRNTREGLHTTSMAAAWMNMVYGFGGMRTDGDTLVFSPSIPKRWKAFSFRVIYRNSVIAVTVNAKDVSLRTTRGPAVNVAVYGKRREIDGEGVTIKLPAGRRG